MSYVEQKLLLMDNIEAKNEFVLISLVLQIDIIEGNLVIILSDVIFYIVFDHYLDFQLDTIAGKRLLFLHFYIK